MRSGHDYPRHVPVTPRPLNVLCSKLPNGPLKQQPGVVSLLTGVSMHSPHEPCQALESLAREIDRLEADILDPALSSAATDPTKACSRLEAYHHRLSDLQVRNKYRVELV